MRMCPINTFPVWKAVAVSSAEWEVLQPAEARLPLQRSWVTPARKQPLLKSPKNTLYQKNNAKMCLDY